MKPPELQGLGALGAAAGDASQPKDVKSTTKVTHLAIKDMISFVNPGAEAGGQT